MSQQPDYPDPEDDEQRIKKHLSASRDVARDLEFEEFLNFEVTLPSQSRRKLMKAAGAGVLTGALAGCSAPSREGQTTTEPPETTTDETTTQETTVEEKDYDQVKEFEIKAHQWEFKPQKISVQPNTKVVLKFVESTFQENDSYNLHSFYLEKPYDIGPIELPKDTDPDVDRKVEFVADQTGTFTYECAIYCGTNHAAMKGTLEVLGDGTHAHQTDFTKMEDVKGTHEILKESSELPDEPQHDVDLRDLMVVTERENQSVAMVDTVNNELVKRINDVGKAIHVHDFHRGLLEDKRDGAYVYTLAREGWLYKVDMYSLTRVARLRGGTDARKPATSRDGKYVAAGYYNPNQLVIADAETLEPLKIIPAHTVNPDGESVGSRICAVHDVPSQGLWVVALKEGGEVWLVDYTKENFPVVATIDVGRILHDGFFTGGDRYFHIASQEDNLMGVIDTHEQKLAARVPTAKVPHPGGPFSQDRDRENAFTISAGTNKLTVYDANTFEVKKKIDTPGKGLFGAKRRDEYCKMIWGDCVLDSENNSVVYQVDPDDLEVVNRIDTSELGDWEGRALHPEFSRDGEKVFISLWDAGKILVFDSETGEHLDTIDGFETPTGAFTGYRAEEHVAGEH